MWALFQTHPHPDSLGVSQTRCTLCVCTNHWMLGTLPQPLPAKILFLCKSVDLFHIFVLQRYTTNSNLYQTLFTQHWNHYLNLTLVTKWDCYYFSPLDFSYRFSIHSEHLQTFLILTVKSHDKELILVVENIFWIFQYMKIFAESCNREQVYFMDWNTKNLWFFNTMNRFIVFRVYTRQFNPVSDFYAYYLIMPMLDLFRRLQKKQWVSECARQMTLLLRFFPHSYGMYFTNRSVSQCRPQTSYGDAARKKGKEGGGDQGWDCKKMMIKNL